MSRGRLSNCVEGSYSGTKGNDDVNIGLSLGVGLTDSNILSSVPVCPESAAAAGTHSGWGGEPVLGRENVLDSPSPIEASSRKTLNASVGPGNLKGIKRLLCAVNCYLA